MALNLSTVIHDVKHHLFGQIKKKIIILFMFSINNLLLAQFGTLSL